MFSAAGSDTPPGFAAAWLGLLAYSMQIYFDFSAYSDMTLGLGRLFGIRLPMNFNSPYKATNIVDFWRRWHMTLSRFLRDYLYIPLGGNRKGPQRRYVNLMITRVLGGLWHGAGWNFAIWGALHGLYLLVHHAWRAWRQEKEPILSASLGRWIGRLVTFYSVLVAWVFFRAESLDAALKILSAMAACDGFSLAEAGFDLSEAVRWTLVFVLVVWIFPSSHEMLAAHQPTLEYQQGTAERSLAPTPGWLRRRLTWRPNIWWALLLAALFAWTILNLSRPSEFIYWQF
jgi:D-alanyl-lipoteichoic acid acyltransferase DltB (MBOAT superfamily)